MGINFPETGVLRFKMTKSVTRITPKGVGTPPK